MPITHTPGCIAYTTEFTAEYQAYLAKYPKFCRHCQGAGGFSGRENVGERNLPVMMESFDPCDDCVGKGNCPRCGEHVWGEDDEIEVCPKCRFDTMKPDALPHFEPCACGMEERC